MRFILRSAVGLLLALSTALAVAQQEAAIAARVNGEPIPAGDVQRLVRETLKEREVEESERALLAKTALEQLISRRLILARLSREGAGAATDEVERAVQSLEKKAQQNKQSFDEWLQTNRFTRETLRQEVAWRIAWRRYLESQLTDPALENYFAKHRREFDGSEVHAAHILWKLPAERTAAAEKAAVDQAQRVREQIASGEMSFTDAARKHSLAASRDEGGDLGFLPRHGVMDEALSRAAFALEPGQVSQPVLTPFGVHLIKCLEVRPGKKTWSECREELRRALAEERFNRLAAEERRGAKIEYIESTR